MPSLSNDDDPGKAKLALTMDKLIKERFSCRFFLPREVPRSTIEQLIDAARFAPSGNNIQYAAEFPL
jgi:nitroreductase